MTSPPPPAPARQRPRDPAGKRDTPHVEERIDESVEETFPASDPPAATDID